MGEKLRLFLTV